MAEDEILLERILDGAEDPTDLPLALLQRITDNFSRERKIGQGGFGAVYKGVFRERIVAVKRIYVNLENIDDDDKQFGRELNSLWNTHHRNVLRFLGFCSNIHHKRIERDGSMILANVRERLFCFEYISNGSLDKHITDELRGLEWETRYEIIMGICKGLRYLHEEKRIIHMDLKPENILLHHQDDKYMVPKITDLGLLRQNEKSYTAGKVYGTRYFAPEYSEGSKTTPAYDVYSLGAIMMELVTGCMEVPNKDNVLRRWRHRWRKPPTTLQYERVTRCMGIAVRCREKTPEARPSISEIISFLSDTESTCGHTGQEISTYLDDDMLGIEPLELRSTLKINKDDDMLGIVKLTNKTNACFSFNIERPSKKYTIRPDKGIVPPGCLEYPIQIAVQPDSRPSKKYTIQQVTYNADKFIVQSTKVSDGFGVEGVTEHMFSPEAGKVVDEVNLMVVYGPVSLKRGREPNVPSDVVPHKVTFRELHHITDGFSEKRLLGTGAFGRVYKGVLDSGEVIAVKKLNAQHGQNDNTFENELQNLMRAKHQNVISLVGYCSEEQDKVVLYEGKFVTAVELVRALCLEYMEGGTLDKLLSDESLGWEARYKIIKGICQGLKYLHKGSKDPIYHLDLKPANVLLDKDGIPKIGDFGLSRLLTSTGTFVTETKSGTRGYMPPEYEYKKQISSKFDVFSLGVIIIEIIAGSEGYYNYKCLMSHQEFIDHVTGNWSKRLQAKTMSTEALLEVQKCIKMALRCVEYNRKNRPTITEIVEELMPETIDLHPAPFCADAKDLESLQLPFTSLTQSSTGLNVGQRPLANFPVDTAQPESMDMDGDPREDILPPARHVRKRYY